MKSDPFRACGAKEHFSRRNFINSMGLLGMSWLTPMAGLLAVEAENPRSRRPAKSLILLWMGGAPSQLDTWDPHPGSKIAGGQRAISTAISGVQFAPTMEQTASVMREASVIRSMVSLEGDHERASYNIKTGYRPNPTVVHPSIGAVVCHQLPDAKIEIPTHVSILSSERPSRGGFLGTAYDAFQVDDPAQPVPDVVSRVANSREEQRMKGLSVVESAFATGRRGDLPQHTQHVANMERARQMMTSKQLKAFDVSAVPLAERQAFGNTAFGRGCLSAIRLIEAGVRCVEVTLSGWDTHANNLAGQAAQCAILDPAYAALIKQLSQRGLLEDTIVICGGEFGRTPKINLLEGRDHWPTGFSMLVAGGGFAGGRVLGATDPSGEKMEPENPVKVEDLHATVQHLLGIESALEVMTPVGRPIKLSEGKVRHELLF